MSIEDLGQQESVEQPIENFVVDIPKVEQSISKKEISPEKIRQTEVTILETLELGLNENLDNFSEKLKDATKLLPKYQEIQKKLEGIKQQDLPYELFKVLKKDLDDTQINPNAPKDGVLIKSMKQGRVECAGRTLIASIFLQESGIDHVVVSAPGHTFIIIEQPQDTLAYFDANSNLFFTFPKPALKGYKGTKTLSECWLENYNPRNTDFADGVGKVFPHFIAMPAEEGIGRQYLNNVAAALNNNKEFETSNITMDKESVEAVHQIETEIYGESPALDSFDSRVESLIKKQEIQAAGDKKVISDILQTHFRHNDFATFFAMALNGNVGDRLPYIRNSSLEQRRIFAEKIWDFLQKGNIDEAMRGR